jgi:uncharacterized protein
MRTNHTTMPIIDFHTHAFPDAVAARAVPQLVAESGLPAALDGTVGDLVGSMDVAGIAQSVVCSIATKVLQFGPILSWSKSIASDRIIPFPSVHPDDPDAADRVRMIKAEGFKGIKLHPYYQDFDLDDKRVFPIYEALQECGLILACHTGFDIAFPRVRRADPIRVLNVLKAFPNLIFTGTHMGGWSDWDEVERHLLGKPIYTEISFAKNHLDDERLREFLLSHPAEYILFGSDSPWLDQAWSIANVKALDLGTEREALILGGNAERLLHG